MYKVHEVEIKIVQEQWIQLKQSLLHENVYLVGRELTFGGG